MRSSSQLYQPVDRGYRDDSSCGTAYVSNNSTLATPSLNLALDNASARSLNISPIVPIAHHVEAYSEDSDTFLTPRMSGASGYYKRFCPPSNYCVYVGSETNRSNCGCNLSRPLGGNCHLSGCPVITSDMEPSTESFPVSGSSQLQNLVRRLHTVVDRLKNGSSPKDERVPCLPIQQPLYWHTDVRSVAVNGYNAVNTVPSASYETIAGASFEYSKRHCSVLPDYNTNREMHPAPEYYVQTSYEDSPYDNSLTAEIDNSLMQRKNVVASKSDIGREVEVQSRNELGRFVPTLTASPISSHECRTQYTTPKASKKKNAAGSTLTGEKVSGVWYDANRHLWRVVYMKGNKRKTQGFSSIKLGYEEARRKAIELRHEMMALRRAIRITSRV
uniref:AP2/ERF domain-containing protein n=1 Tax=Babesia bovis TaxID=5865 RepID=S6BLQ7_BABBO|nr:hypothetical protein [Babesia bovis]